MTSRRTVIVGGGPAAHRLVDALVSRRGEEVAPRSIVVLAEEPYLPYDRVQLSKRLADGTVDLTLEPASHWEDAGVELRVGEAATVIDRAAKTVTTSTSCQKSSISG